MTKRKTAAAADLPVEQSNTPAEPTTGQATDAGQPTSSAAGDATADDKRKSTWAKQFGSWADYEAGVKLIEDRENRRMTIAFDEKPSDAVRTLMKSGKYGFRFDPDDKLWYKPISQGKPAQVRREADELAFEAANIIRQEKGMEQKKSFNIGM